MSDLTTDISRLKIGCTFTWGKVLRIIEVENYTFVKYNPWEYGKMSERVPSDKISYHIWIDNIDTSRGAPTIEQAMALAIAYKFDGPNTKADTYFCKSIGIGD